MAIIFASISLNAQSKILQVLTSGAKTSAAKKVEETAVKTMDRLLEGKLFKRKNGKSNKTDTVLITKEQSIIIGNLASTTDLIISNTDYSSVVALADVIKSNKNVTGVQRSFSDGSGIISVIHNCKTEELLDDILKNSASNYEVIELVKGKISLKAKK